MRVPRRLRPILAALVKTVWRCANRDSRSEPIREVLGVRTAGVHADGKVGHDADAHTRIQGCLLCLAELLIENPLHPEVEVEDFLPQRFDTGVVTQRWNQLDIVLGYGTRIGSGSACSIAGSSAIREFALGAPRRVVVYATALGLQPTVKFRLACAGQGDLVNCPQYLELCSVDGVAVNLIRAVIELVERVR